MSQKRPTTMKKLLNSQSEWEEFKNSLADQRKKDPSIPGYYPVFDPAPLTFPVLMQIIRIKDSSAVKQLYTFTYPTEFAQAAFSSGNLIGNVKEVFQKEIYQQEGTSYQSFYDGWLEGRMRMIGQTRDIIGPPTRQSTTKL